MVTVFMLGLGLGSLAGGWLSRNRRDRLLPAYGAIELAVGVFGLFSLDIFHRVGEATAGASAFKTGVIAFAVLLVPTVLLGSTLPLLVEQLVRRNGNVGESVGILYAVNTLGSAAACFAAAAFLMRLLGESGSVRLSACINLGIGVTALLLQENTEAAVQMKPSAAAGRKTGRFSWGLLLAGVMGFAALGYEVLWYRAYAFTSGGAAPCFAELLAYYLAGIAYGSFNAREACRKRLENDLPETIRTTASVVLAGSVAAFLVVPIAAHCAPLFTYHLTFIFVFIAAALMGSAFPLTSHAFINPARHSGARVSLLYLSNIAGSVLGSFLIGFVISDYWSMRAISLLLLAITTASAIALVMLSGARPHRGVVFGLSVCVGLALVSGPLFSSLYERLLLKSSYKSGIQFSDLVENRSGVIAVTPEGVIFGGGVYDGMFDTGLVPDPNLLFRVFALAGMNRKPASVLDIGISGGAWAQVLVNDPDVQSVTGVEINPGYLPLIRKYPTVRSLLTNAKFHLVIDDGRRWLISHPDRKFDMIVMNTTWNFRANASNLLSTEFLAIVRQHLNPGGIAFYNTTWSREALATGAETFPYAMRIASFLAVSDRPFRIDPDAWRAVLLHYQINGKPVLDLRKPEDQSRLDLLLKWVRNMDAPDSIFESRESLLRRVRGARLITDDNMGTEWASKQSTTSE